MTTAIPPYTETEARTRANFLALMWALSYPGRPHALTLPTSTAFTAHAPSIPPACVALGETLLDLETTFYTPDPALFDALAHTTARPETIERAEYVFYPALGAADLPTLARAQVGTMMRPDHGATLILGGILDQDGPDGTADSLHLRLSGPGIDGEGAIRIGGIPAAFWELRARVGRYPLGWDVFVVQGAKVVGLPRTTIINWD